METPPPTPADAATAASGASGTDPPPELAVAVASMLRLENHSGSLQQWSLQIKAYVDNALPAFLAEYSQEFTFKLPSKMVFVPALAISASAATGAVSAFREVMRYDNLQHSFGRNGQCEAAGTMWMLDAISKSNNDSAPGEQITVSQLEGAAYMFSQEAFALSSPSPQSRPFSFNVPLPAAVANSQIVQRLAAGKDDVIMAHALPIIAGRAQVLAWYAAMGGGVEGL